MKISEVLQGIYHYDLKPGTIKIISLSLNIKIITLLSGRELSHIIDLDNPFIRNVDDNILSNIDFDILMIPGVKPTVYSKLSTETNWVKEDIRNGLDGLRILSKYMAIENEMKKLQYLAGLSCTNLKYSSIITNIIEIDTLGWGAIDSDYIQLGSNSTCLTRVTSLTREEYLNQEFQRSYEKAIKCFTELKPGTKLYGVHFKNATVSSGVFKDSAEVLWCQVSGEESELCMISLETYGINFNGTHNLLFLNEEDYRDYRKLELLIDSSNSEYYVWVEPIKNTRTKISQEDMEKFPVREWSVITNDFIN